MDANTWTRKKRQEKKERQEAANELRKLEEGKPKRNLSAYLLYSQDRRYEAFKRKRVYCTTHNTLIRLYSGHSLLIP